MSATIDERVVEMRFDNRHFENNVSNTMSTLDKLKQKLNLSGASKGLENVNSAAKNVNMTGLGTAVETVRTKFSALEVMGVTALANITNSAVNAGKKIISALTIDPVMSGFQEYETKMGSIQTILANTEHQGTTMDDVTAALEELNLYADKTIYNFQEMTRNIGTFTAAGVDLDTSVKSIQGIANLAAVSGSTSQQASTAMYQLSQALATGTVKLMDWNSVVNAGMGGKVFQNALIRTAAMLDGAADDVAAWQEKNVDAYGSFRESLTQGAWLTSEVLTETLKQFTMSAEEGTEQWEAYKKSLMDQGYAEAQAEEILKMANTATDAATKVKTFTQLFDTLKESAQSGWAQTWELLFGDFEEAKEFFTGLSDMIGGVINSMSEYRNNLLGGVLDSGWDKLVSKISSAGRETGEYEEAIRAVWIAHGKTSDQLDEQIEKYGSLEKAIKNGAISTDILKEALAKIGLGASKTKTKLAGFVEGLEKIERILGWGSVGDDVKALQTALEELGHTVGVCGIDGIIGPDTTKAIKEFQKAAGLAVDGIAGPETIEALKKAGTSIEELSGNVNEASINYDELVDSITKKGGRELFLESFSNVINGLMGTFRAFGKAWADIFPAQNAQKALLSALEMFNKFSQSLRLFDEVVDENGNTIIKFNENGEKLVRTFKGILAVVDIVTTILGSGLKFAFETLGKILNTFDLNILDVTAAVGDAIVEFRDFIFENDILAKVIDRLVSKLPIIVDRIKAWFSAFKETPAVQKFITAIEAINSAFDKFFNGEFNASEFAGSLGTNLANALKSLPEIAKQLGKEFIAKFRDGIDFDISGTIKYVRDVCGEFINAFTETLGIELPFVDRIKEWFAVFKETPAVQNLVNAINAIRSAFDKFSTGEFDVTEFATTLGTNLASALKSIPEIAIQIGKDFIAGFQNGIGASISNVINNIKTFCIEFVAAFAEALGVQSPSWKAYDIMVDFFQGAINGIKSMISSVLGVLSTVGEQIIKVFRSLWDYITDESGNIEWGKLFAGGIIVSIIWVVKQLATAFSGIAGALGNFDDLLLKAGRVLDSFRKVLNAYAWDLKAEALKKLAISIAILVAAIWVLAQIDDVGKLWNAVGVIAALSVILVGLAFAMDKLTQASVSIGKNGASIDGFKTGLTQIGIALLLLAATVKLIGSMDLDQAKQGFIGLAGMAVGMIIFLAAIGGVSRYSKDVVGFGKVMTKLSLAMLLLVVTIKLIAGMDMADIFTGVLVMEAFILLIMQMGLASRIAGQDNKFGGTVLGMAAAMILMAGAIKIISGIDPSDIITGVLVMEAFVLLIMQMGLANRLAGQSGKIGGTILGMSIAMLTLAAVAKILAGMNVADLTKGLIIMEIFVLIIAEMLLLSKLGKDTGKVAGTILSMAAAVGILAGVAVLLSLIDINGLAKGVIAVGMLSAMMALMARSLKGAQNVKGAIMMMAICIGVMAASIVALSFIDPHSLIGASAALGILMGMFALMVTMSSKIKASVGSLAIMLVVVVMLAGILAALSLLNVGSTIEIAASIGLLMLTLGATMVLISAAGPQAMLGVGALAIMGLVVAELAIILGLMSHFNVKPSIETATSLSILLIAMSAALVVLGIVGAMGPAAFIGIGALATLIAGIGGLVIAIGALMTKFPKLEEFLNKGIPILEKIGLALGSFFGNVVGGFFGGMGEGLTSGLPTMIEDIKTFIDGLSEVATVADGIKAESFAGVGGLVQAMLGISVGSLVEHFTSLITGESSMESFKTTAISFVEAIAAISDKLSNVSINDSAIEAITNCGTMFATLNKSLPRTGGIAQDLAGEKDLGLFAQSCKAFASAMIQINAAVSGEGFVVQSERISALVTAGQRFNELNTALPKTGGIAQDLAGEQDLSLFATSCKAFAAAMIQVNTAVSGDNFVVQSDRISALVKAGQRFNELNTALPKTGGIAQDLAGEQDLSLFATSCKAFAAAMVEVNTAVGGEGFSMNVAAIDTLKQAGLKFNELQNSLPKTGGWWQEIAGQSDLEDFGNKISAFGSAMSAYSTSVSGLDTGSITASISTANKIKSLVSSLAGLDTSGVASFAGVGAGDGHLVNIGQAIASYSSEVAGVDAGAMTASISAANKIKSLINSLVGLDTSGVDKFKPEPVGESMKGYSDSVKKMDTGTVSSSISAANRLKTFISGLSGLDTSGIGNFNVTSIGDSLNSYSTSVSGIDSGSVSSSISAANRLKTFISSLSGLDTSGVSSFKNAISSLAKTNVSDFTKAFSGSTVKMSSIGSNLINSIASGIKTKASSLASAATSVISSMSKAFSSKTNTFNTIGSNLMNRFISGIKSRNSQVRSATTSSISSGVSSARNYYTSFYNAGSYLVTGFANGITANTWRASARSAAMAQAALNAAKEKLRINSPSKAFRDIGTSVPEGFAMGIDKLGGMVITSSVSMADNAINTVKDSISRIADVVNTDIDSQPMIRPVLDLSDVRSGADAISSMFGGGASVGVLANVGGISSMMNRNSQNGGESEVVSAINRLRKDLGNIGGTSYTINGITYDDGSNITNAVESLVRAAKVGRRI